jgi:hypothetical protein
MYLDAGHIQCCAVSNTQPSYNIGRASDVPDKIARKLAAVAKRSELSSGLGEVREFVGLVL